MGLAVSVGGMAVKVGVAVAGMAVMLAVGVGVADAVAVGSPVLVTVGVEVVVPVGVTVGVGVLVLVGVDVGVLVCVRVGGTNWVGVLTALVGEPAMSVRMGTASVVAVLVGSEMGGMLPVGVALAGTKVKPGGAMVAGVPGPPFGRSGARATAIRPAQ